MSIRDKITRKPTYSTEKTKEGYVTTFSIQIDGKEYMAESRSQTQAQSIATARENFARKVSNDYETSGISKSNLEQVLGSSAQRETAKEARFRALSELNKTESERSPSDFLDSMSVNDLSAMPTEEAEFLQREQNRPRPISSKVHQRSEKQKNHVPWSVGLLGLGSNLDGIGDTELEEPNPEYFKRPGEKIIQGMNNAAIVLGRDRSPTNRQVFSKNIDEREYNSGYSDYMCAGAIDIVVGRGAPFPITRTSNFGDIILAPSFNTERPPELQGLQLEAGEHPGILMDAARIYISQMTNIDENFNITKELGPTEEAYVGDVNSNWTKQKVVPTSAIMLKADKLRMHARQDIKIVTGGPKETFNSLGNPIKQNNGIHLIAQNGKDVNGRPLPQQPMVLGDNLVIALGDFAELMEDLVGALDALTTSQMNFNSIVANNFDLLPIPGGATVPNPFKMLAGIVTQLELLIKTRFGCLHQNINLFRQRTSYLSDSNDSFILSRHNTVN